VLGALQRRCEAQRLKKSKEAAEKAAQRESFQGFGCLGYFLGMVRSDVGSGQKQSETADAQDANQVRKIPTTSPAAYAALRAARRPSLFSAVPLAPVGRRTSLLSATIGMVPGRRSSAMSAQPAPGRRSSAMSAHPAPGRRSSAASAEPGQGRRFSLLSNVMAPFRPTVKEIPEMTEELDVEQPLSIRLKTRRSRKSFITPGPRRERSSVVNVEDEEEDD